MAIKKSNSGTAEQRLGGNWTADESEELLVLGNRLRNQGIDPLEVLNVVAVTEERLAGVDVSDPIGVLATRPWAVFSWRLMNRLYRLIFKASMNGFDPVTGEVFVHEEARKILRSAKKLGEQSKRAKARSDTDMLQKIIKAQMDRGLSQPEARRLVARRLGLMAPALRKRLSRAEKA